VYFSRLFAEVSGGPLPAVGILNHTWMNRAAQFAILALGVNCPRDMVDFSGLVKQEQVIPVSSLTRSEPINTPPNFSWMCIPLYYRLIDLARAGLVKEVMELLIKGASSYPEYVLISLAQLQFQTQDQVGVNVRGDLLRRLLPVFTGLQGSRSTYASVMRKLCEVNSEMFVLLCRIAMKKAKRAWEILNVDAVLKTLDGQVIRRLEEEGSPDELLSYYCVKADRGEMVLEEKLRQLLEMKPSNARVFVNFAKAHHTNLKPRVVLIQESSNASTDQDMGLLSLECYALLLRAVQAFPSVVPADEIRVLAQVYSQHQQALQQNVQMQQQNMTQQLPGNGSRDPRVLSGTPTRAAIPGSGNTFPPEAIELARLPPGPEGDEIDRLANSYFQKIYTTEISVSDAMVLLRQLKASNEKKDQEIFRSMVHNLFDEYRFFHKYPEKELSITARLFGSLVQHQLISSITSGIALRYVLEALRKEPELGESNDKMFRFGRIALDQFRQRLGEWPQFCSHLIQISHLVRYCPDVHRDAQNALAAPTQQQHGVQQQITLSPSLSAMSFGAQQRNSFDIATSGMGAMNITSTPSTGNTIGIAATSQHQFDHNLSQVDKLGNNGLNTGSSLPPLPGASFQQLPVSDSSKNFSGSGSSLLNSPQLSSQYNPQLHQSNVDSIGSLASGTSSLLSSMAASLGNGGVGAIAKPSDHEETNSNEVRIQQNNVGPLRRRHVNEIERMAKVNGDVLSQTLPPEGIRDQIHFIVNNIAKNNFDAKIKEMKLILKSDHFNWFANYLVVKRISTQPNLHPLYLSILDVLESPPLMKLVLDSAYHNVTKLLQSPNITTSSSERSLLRNLGVWLGQITLACNRPLLQRRIDLKELLFWGFETGRLIAVCSFVAKIVEGVKDSKVFKPPNPWLMAILGLLRELYEIEDLKLNIKFEVQVLCKNINVKIEDIPKSNELSRCQKPVKDSRNPDFNYKAPAPSASQQSPQNAPVAAPAASPSLTGVGVVRTNVDSSPLLQSGAGSKIVTPVGSVAELLQTFLVELPSIVVVSSALSYFTSNPGQRRLVVVAVERAIREIIQGTVDRSVAIASATMKFLVFKDFATEPNEKNLRDGAVLMTSTLSGSLALATCKESLRIAIGNHLRSLLTQSISDQTMIEQIVQVCSNDNIELCSSLIEKAAVEKSIKDAEELIADASEARRKARDEGSAFIDETFAKNYAISPECGEAINDTAKYSATLNESLRPRLGGLSPQQLKVYQAFHTVKLNHIVAGSTVPTDFTQTGVANMSSLPPVSGTASATLTMSQSLELYQKAFSRIDASLRSLQAQLQGREVNMNMLGSDHEIYNALRDIVATTQRTQNNVRNETAMTFSEIIFNRTFESINQPDPLRLEVCVGILEAVREAAGGSKVFSPDFISWLGKYAMLVNNDEIGRKVYRLILVLLLRAKLICCRDLDAFFVMYIDGGRNLFWLELALSFIRQCLVENMGNIVDFRGTFDAVTKMRPTNPVLKKQLQKWLSDVSTLTSAQEEQKAVAAALNSSTNTLASVQGVGTSSNIKDNAMREQVMVLFDRWLRIWVHVNDQGFHTYLQMLHHYGVIKTEESADRFFRLATELCVEACLRNQQQVTPQESSSDSPSSLNFTFMDALSKLLLAILRLADKESNDLNVKINLLNRILNAVARALRDDIEAKKIAASNGLSVKSFDQRPYYRLFSNLSHELGIPDAKGEPNPAMLPMVVAYTQVYLELQPAQVPAFAYAWIQLVSRRSYMPHLLLAKDQKGWPYLHRLLNAFFSFLQPFLKSGTLSDAVRKLYTGSLRVLLILLHDFPDFLSEYHLSLCDIIPANCVQLRNIILSAFPKKMKLPDPLTPSLKIDAVAEASQAPRILSDYLSPINSIRQHLDNYMATQQPPDLPSRLPTVLMTPNQPLVTSLVMYTASVGIQLIQTGKSSLQNSPAMAIYKQLVAGSVSAEGRYLVLNTMANQLRYPNSHTSFFSYVLLKLFDEANDEYVQEQLTRVLVERLIVHRPHPWGLLVTFIELIKNPQHRFWTKSFTRSAPEIERVFELIAQSCMGSTASNIIQEQIGDKGSSNTARVH